MGPVRLRHRGAPALRRRGHRLTGSGIIGAGGDRAASSVELSAAASGEDGGRPLNTTLTGAAEAPGPGDANGSGTASITLNQGLGTVCFDLAWQDVAGTVFAGHIHVAPVGSPGPIVVPLFSGTFAGTDSVSGCVENVDPELIKAIRHDPAAYYVNIHSRPDFPGGALRGQLGK